MFFRITINPRKEIKIRPLGHEFALQMQYRIAISILSNDKPFPLMLTY